VVFNSAVKLWLKTIYWLNNFSCFGDKRNIFPAFPTSLYCLTTFPQRSFPLTWLQDDVTS